MSAATELGTAVRDALDGAGYVTEAGAEESEDIWQAIAAPLVAWLRVSAVIDGMGAAVITIPATLTYPGPVVVEGEITVTVDSGGVPLVTFPPAP